MDVFPDYLRTKYKIRKYKQKKFRAQFAGGASYYGDKNSIIIIVVFDSEGKVFFIIVPYKINSNLLKEIKDSENNEENIHVWDEDERDLAIRKLYEEVGLIANKSDLVSLVPRIVPSRKEGQDIHTKYCFVLENFSGELLTNSSRGLLRLETDLPFLVPGPLLAGELYIGHLDYFEEAIDLLKNKLRAGEYSSMKRIILERRKRKSFR